MIGKMISLSKHSFLGNGGLLRFGNNRNFSPIKKERDRSPPFGNEQVAIDNSDMT